MPDGELIIGTKIDDKGFDKQLTDLERKYKNRELDIYYTSKNLKEETLILDSLNEKADELDEEYRQINEKIKEQKEIIKASSQPVDDKTVRIKDIDTYSKAQDEVWSLKEKSYRILEELEKQNAEISKQEKIVDRINAKYEKQKNDLEVIQAKINQSNIKDIDLHTKSLNNSLGKVVKNVFRWSLAIFGIRSAYMLVRQAMSTLSQYDEQMAKNVEWIRYLLASALKPIIETIINLVYKLLAYINYIAQAWFGVNLFANASTKEFAKQSKAMGSTAKSAKDLKKTLASFDEMNVLPDTTSSSGGGGTGSGVSLPSFPKMEDVEIPAWVKWIAENGPLVISILAGIAGALIALKLGLDPIMSLGVGLAITGILIAIQGIIGYLNDPSWKNFGKIITGIGLAVAGVALVFEAWPVAIAGAIVAIIGIIVSNWEKIKAYFENILNQLQAGSEFIHQKFGDTIGKIYDTFVDGLKLMLNGFDDFFSGLKKILDGIIQFVKGVFTGNWKQAWEGVKTIFSGILQSLVGIIKTVVGSILAVVVTIAQGVGSVIASVFKGVINIVLNTIENVLNAPIRAINGMIKVINTLPGVDIKKLDVFKLPRLARGGIVNMPSRGVMVGGAIAGERGAEGVIPLTDSQQMQLLGEAIGKYVTVNLTNVNQMNGRVLSREIKKIESENDFAFNR